MEEKNCINAGRPVYFSYARNSQRKPEWEHISDCMDKLLEVFEEKNIEYRLDKRDIGTGDKISTFENEIGWKSEVVVIVFSDKYFRSMHCMYEFVQIKRALEQYPEKRLMCIKSGDFNLADINYIMELEQYWNNQKIEYEKIEYHRL
ncbi:MAG: toll/interleukin-1 receptor domain-containing protein, partial [Bacteroidales bacterium]|nr:toll/interleukin-1 receptor domain-containing protein [Bacteroidales bacterium]